MLSFNETFPLGGSQTSLTPWPQFFRSRTSSGSPKFWSILFIFLSFNVTVDSNASVGWLLLGLLGLDIDLFPLIGELVVLSPFYEIKNSFWFEIPFYKKPRVGLNLDLGQMSLLCFSFACSTFFFTCCFSLHPFKFLAPLVSSFGDLIPLIPSPLASFFSSGRSWEISSSLQSPSGWDWGRGQGDFFSLTPCGCWSWSESSPCKHMFWYFRLIPMQYRIVVLG